MVSNAETDNKYMVGLAGDLYDPGVGVLTCEI